MSGTSGSSGLGSVNNEQMDSSTCSIELLVSGTWGLSTTMWSTGDRFDAGMTADHSLCRTCRPAWPSGTWDKSQAWPHRQRPAHLGHRQRWTPLLFQDVQTDAAIAVDVGVVHLRLEVDLQQDTICRRKACPQQAPWLAPSKLCCLYAGWTAQHPA